jgi:hypothetical protein
MIIRQVAAQGATATVETACHVKFPVSANFGKKFVAAQKLAFRGYEVSGWIGRCLIRPLYLSGGVMGYRRITSDLA